MRRRQRPQAFTPSSEPLSSERGRIADAGQENNIPSKQLHSQHTSESSSTNLLVSGPQLIEGQHITPPDHHSKTRGALLTLAKAACITAIAFLLSFLISSPFSASISTLFSASDKSDFNMTDLFCQIADNRPVRVYDDRIRILDIGNLDRAGIAEVLSVLSLAGPRAVAIDVNFEATSENDTLLLAALNSLPALVLPLGVEQTGDRFRITDKPFFYGDLPGATYGIVNFPTKHPGASVREYAVQFPMADGGHILSFPEAAAKAGGFETNVSTSGGDKVKTGIIGYHSKEISKIPYYELPDRLEELHDKIILVGTTMEAGDVYATPLRRGVSGLEIHAYALSTLLDGSPLRRLPPFVADIVAIVLCFLMVWGAIGIKWGTKGLLLRLAQVVSLYFLVWGGYTMLVDHDTVSDFSQAILMVTFGLFAADLWCGSEAIVNWAKKKINTIRSKRNKQQPI